jgi:competence protein ComEC
MRPNIPTKPLRDIAINWAAMPFLRFIVPLIVGIVVSEYVAWQPMMRWILLGLVVVCALSLYFLKLPFQWRSWIGLPLFVGIAAFGFLRAKVFDERNAADYFAKAMHSDTSFVTGIVSAPPILAHRVKVRLAIQSIDNELDRQERASGMVLCYLDSTAESASLKYGDVIAFQGRINAVTPPLNPLETDMQAVLHTQNVHHRAFLKGPAWQQIGENGGSPLFKFTYGLQRTCINALYAAVPSRNEQSVAAALLIGYTDDISDEVKSAYINTGSMHVLSVSGLHVGLLYVALSWLLGRIKTRHKAWKWFSVVLQLLFLWGFALVTGASAAVLRSAAMLSIVILGNAIQRKTSGYNTLTVTAFGLLCINPFWVWNIGFQLSFLAVFGLLFLYRPVYQLFTVGLAAAKLKKGAPKTLKYRFWRSIEWLLDWAWNVTAVSIAAQITTLPLALYYFHQFPLYFWLSGLIVIPLATLALWLGVLAIFTNWLPFVGKFFGFLLYATVWLMNKTLMLIEQFPLALIDGFWIEKWQMWCFYGIILGAAATIYTRKLNFAFAPLGLAVCWAAVSCVQAWRVQNDYNLVVHQAYRRTIVGAIGNKAAVYFNDATGNTALMDMTSKNLRLAQGVKNTAQISIFDTLKTDDFYANPPFYQYRNLRFAIIRPENLPKGSIEKPLKLDFVVLSQHPKTDITTLQTLFETKRFIADGSNAPWHLERWKLETEANKNIDFWQTNTQAAFIQKAN